ncbi:MAG: hypothetical protein PHC51_05300 [bacterium]|nr:hypothetical protein [bacterium]
MKKIIVVLIVALFSVSSLAVAETQVADMKGGRFLEMDGLTAEFFIEKDHYVSLTFHNDKLERVPVTSQVATLTADAPSGKKKIEFETKGGSLFSKEPLPEGHGYNLIVQLKHGAASKPKNFRIPFETSLCRECGKAEYACSCEGH